MRLAAIRLAALVVAAIVAAGCLLQPAGGASVRLENATTVPVAIHVDGAWVGTYPAGAVVDIPVSPSATAVVVEARTANGAVLVRYAADADQLTGGGGGSSSAEFPCGSVRLSSGAGDLPTLTPPDGSAGACP